MTSSCASRSRSAARRSSSISREPRRNTPGTSTARFRSRARPATSSLRCLTDPDLPASGGAFAPVTVVARARLARERVAAGGGGRGQRRDLEPDRRRRLRRLLAVHPGSAQGQGTVNNLTLGNRISPTTRPSAAGRAPSQERTGPSGVHVAISNTLNTPVEALELAYPLRVERYGLRLGSGGEGEHRGGDGVVRTIRVLEDCRCSLLTERRAHAPRRALRRHRRAARAQPPKRDRAPREGHPRARSGRGDHDRDSRRRRFRPSSESLIRARKIPGMRGDAEGKLG